MAFTKTTHHPHVRLQKINNTPFPDVHKNETPGRGASDTLPPGVTSSRIPHRSAPRSVSVPQASSTPESHPFSKRKGATTVRAHRTLTHRTLMVSAILALALLAPASAIASKRLVIAGSTSMLPLVEKLATAYHKAYPRIAKPKVEGGQTDIGIDDVHSGRADIGDASRDPMVGVDPPGLVFTKVARDGVCVITTRPTRCPTSPRKRFRGSSPAISATGATFRNRASPARSTCSTAKPSLVRRTPSRISSSGKA